MFWCVSHSELLLVLECKQWEAQVDMLRTTPEPYL